jgi:hypothetical protein
MPSVPASASTARSSQVAGIQRGGIGIGDRGLLQTFIATSTLIATKDTKDTKRFKISS